MGLFANGRNMPKAERLALDQVEIAHPKWYYATAKRRKGAWIGGMFYETWEVMDVIFGLLIELFPGGGSGCSYEVGEKTQELKLGEKTLYNWKAKYMDDALYWDYMRSITPKPSCPHCGAGWERLQVNKIGAERPKFKCCDCFRSHTHNTSPKLSRAKSEAHLGKRKTHWLAWNNREHYAIAEATENMSMVSAREIAKRYRSEAYINGSLRPIKPFKPKKYRKPLKQYKHVKKANDNIRLAHKLAKKGLKPKEIAAVMDIGLSTAYSYLKREPNVKMGKAMKQWLNRGVV